MGHQICFYGEIWLIIPKISLLPLLINLMQCKSICYIFLQVSLLKSVKEENKTFLMMGHQICLYGEIWLIIPKISLLPLLINLLQCKSICYILLQVSLLKSVKEENKAVLMMGHKIRFY